MYKTRTKKVLKKCRPQFSCKYIDIQITMPILFWFSGTSSGRTQQTACAVLEEMCQCASGDIGCDKASLDEINVLLNALQVPQQAVRDAALRVRSFRKED